MHNKVSEAQLAAETARSELAAERRACEAQLKDQSIRHARHLQLAVSAAREEHEQQRGQQRLEVEAFVHDGMAAWPRTLREIEQSQEAVAGLLEGFHLELANAKAAKVCVRVHALGMTYAFAAVFSLFLSVCVSLARARSLSLSLSRSRSRSLTVSVHLLSLFHISRPLLLSLFLIVSLTRFLTLDLPLIVSLILSLSLILSHSISFSLFLSFSFPLSLNLSFSLQEVELRRWQEALHEHELALKEKVEEAEALSVTLTSMARDHDRLTVELTAVQAARDEAQHLAEQRTQACDGLEARVAELARSLANAERVAIAGQRRAEAAETRLRQLVFDRAESEPGGETRDGLIFLISMCRSVFPGFTFVAL